MEIALLIGLLVLLILAGAMVRSWAMQARRSKKEADEAWAALDTTRRIDDATRDTSDPTDARDWLREFGTKDPTGKR